jgi:hypothetical protein
MARSSHEPEHFIGIDVQIRRGLAIAVMDGSGSISHNLWQAADEPKDAIESLLSRYPNAAFGIDAPRRPLPAPREHYWDRTGWRARRPSDRGHGRHCEVVVSACRLARPQWTPLADAAPDWMRLGFALFEACETVGVSAEEVFPSAAYKQLEHDPSAQVQLSWRGFAPGPKDMLDASMAAYSLREYRSGRGGACGGGDGLGTIVLPRPVGNTVYAAVQQWPERSYAAKRHPADPSSAHR